MCNIFYDSILLKNWGTLVLHVLETTVGLQKIFKQATLFINVDSTYETQLESLVVSFKCSFAFLRSSKVSLHLSDMFSLKLATRPLRIHKKRKNFKKQLKTFYQLLIKLENFFRNAKMSQRHKKSQREYSP